jgi:hypothetical protein
MPNVTAPVVDDLAISLAILVQAVAHVKVVAWLLLLQPLQQLVLQRYKFLFISSNTAGPCRTAQHHSKVCSGHALGGRNDVQ